MLWYYANQGKQAGPVDDAALEQLARQGVIQPQTLVWREGMAQWQPLSVARPAPAAPSPAPPPQAATPTPSPYSSPMPSSPQPSGYGQPQQSSPMGQPGGGFGQPSSGMASGFGQPGVGGSQPSGSNFEQMGYGSPRAASPSAPTPGYGSPSPVGIGAPMGSPSQTITCANCGQLFPTSAAVMIGSSWVCSTCKPVYMQRMREGGYGMSASGMRYGGFWMRFAAVFIDGIIVGLAQMLITVPLGMVLGTSSSSSAAFGLMGLIYLIMFGLRIAYDGYFVATKGATPGKQILGLKVVRADGGPIPMGRSFGRAAAKVLLGAITFGIGYIIAAFDKDKRALHDMICDTRVVTTR